MGHSPASSKWERTGALFFFLCFVAFFGFKLVNLLGLFDIVGHFGINNFSALLFDLFVLIGHFGVITFSAFCVRTSGAPVMYIEISSEF
jgi:hypothetical protein